MIEHEDGTDNLGDVIRIGGSGWGDGLELVSGVILYAILTHFSKTQPLAHSPASTPNPGPFAPQ